MKKVYSHSGNKLFNVNLRLRWHSAHTKQKEEEIQEETSQASQTEAWASYYSDGS